MRKEPIFRINVKLDESSMIKGTKEQEVADKGEGKVEIRIHHEPENFTREAYWIEQGEKRIYGELYRPTGSEDCPLLIMSHGFNGSRVHGTGSDLSRDSRCPGIHQLFRAAV